MPWSDQNLNRITLASRLRIDLEDKEQGKQLRKDGVLEQGDTNGAGDRRTDSRVF